MSLTARLQKATRSLSPLQRATLVLQCLREGREPDPELRRIDDPVQRRAFNRYMAYLWVANHELGAVSAITSHRVEVAESALGYWQLLNQAAADLEADLGEKPSKGSRNWRSKPEVSVPELLRSLALEARDDAVRQVEHLWRETLALEACWTELAEEFGGEDIVLPEYRQQAKETEGRLRAAAKAVGLRRLPAEAGEELTRAFLAGVAASFQHLGYAEA